MGERQLQSKATVGVGGGQVEEKESPDDRQTVGWNQPFPTSSKQTTRFADKSRSSSCIYTAPITSPLCLIGLFCARHSKCCWLPRLVAFYSFQHMASYVSTVTYAPLRLHLSPSIRSHSIAQESRLAQMCFSRASHYFDSRPRDFTSS